MTYKKIDIHSFNFDNRKESFKGIVNKKEYDLVMNYLSALGNGEVNNKGINVTDNRQRKILDMLLIYYKNYKKPFSILKYADLQKIKFDILNNKIQKQNGQPYSPDTKEDYTETLVRFIEWNYPEKVGELASKNLPFRKWFIIRAKKKTPEILKEEEIEKLISGSKTIEGKFIIAVLFDLGCRIEEFCNIRFEDIEEPTNSFPYYKIDLKEEYSKTEGRKVGLYWKLTTEIVNKYLSITEKKNMKEPVFDKSYDAIRMFLNRIGMKVLGKKVNPHMIRKSSATYYADKLNRQQLCLRYGWKFSSEMPDVYISRAGVDEEKIKETMVNTDLSHLKEEIKTIKKYNEHFAEIVVLMSKEKKTNKDNKRLAELGSILSKENIEILGLK